MTFPIVDSFKFSNNLVVLRKADAHIGNGLFLFWMRQIIAKNHRYSIIVNIYRKY